MYKRNTRPILVTGSHRSGSTWVGRTIAEHPNVKYVREPFNVSGSNVSIGMELDTWFTDFHSSNKKEEISTAFNRLLRRTHLNKTIDICKEAGIDSKTPLRFLKHLLLSWDGRILVKDPIALLSAGWLHETYGFNVIVMIRNPLAFVGSLKLAGWDFDFNDILKQKVLMSSRLSKYADEIEYMCSEGNTSDFIDRVSLLWNILHFTILEYQEKYPSWLFVKYENIAAQPETRFRGIFEFLNLEFDSTILDYINEYTAQKNPEKAKSTSYQPRESKLSLTTWKKRLTNEEVVRIKASTSEIASQLYVTASGDFN